MLRKCGKYEPNDEYGKSTYEILKEAVKPIIPDIKGFRDSVIKRLQYANEYSLSKRLRELTRTVKGLIDSYMPNDKTSGDNTIKDKDIVDSFGFTRSGKSIGNFAQITVNTRNHLTHYDPESESDEKFVFAQEKSEILKMTHRLAFILEICLLKEIGLFDVQNGLDSNAIVRAIENMINRQYPGMLL